jgi:hypothetical protein
VPVIVALFSRALAASFQFIRKRCDFLGAQIAAVGVGGDGLKFIASSAHYAASGPGSGADLRPRRRG